MSQIPLLAGSLVAVLLLALAARLLGLGGGGIWSEAEAIAAAEEIVAGFEGVRAEAGKDGRAALVHGEDGTMVLLKMHGARPAARLLRPPLDARPTGEGLLVRTGDRRFGDVLLKGVEAA